MTDTNHPQTPDAQDELRKKVTQLRRDRDAHQMDESDYVDSVVALTHSEVRQVLERLESESQVITVRSKTMTLDGPRLTAVNNYLRIPLSAIEKEIKKYE
jgi:Pyrimidine reductase, riboflavin biosynthesis